MSLADFLGRAYRFLDMCLLSRLPADWQRAVASAALSVARVLFPYRVWSPSVAPLLARRMPRAVPKAMQVLPDWALRDMDDLALRVDPLLGPGSYIAGGADFYAPPIHWQEAGATYRHLRSQLQGEFETILIVPWLKRGGADLGALHHARACHEVFGQRTLVIATEPSDSPWASRLPQGVEFLQAGDDLGRLSAPHAEPEAVLARLLIQLAPKRVHVIGAHVGWRTLVRHGLALSQSTRLFASLFCDDRDGHGYRDGPAVRYLSGAAPHLRAVISDNTVSPVEWTETLGVAAELFHVVHFPAPELRPNRPSTPGRRLLWASRLDRQKRPDLLAELVRALPEYTWDIHGTHVVPGETGEMGLLVKARNATLHGAYDKFSEVVRPDHLAFIYTSAWDGLPNVLLEAASSGLPIVAPDVGGIRDLIPMELLIRPDADVERFTAAIRALEEANTRQEWLRRQQEKLTHFSWEAFIAGLRGIPGYAE